MRYVAVALLLVGAVVANAQPLVFFRYGESWKSMSSELRVGYIEGYVEGGGDVYNAAYNYLTPAVRDQLRKSTAVIYDAPVLAATVTELYKDPANTFIRFGTMILIARDKLNGADIEPRLRHARASERGYAKQ